MVRTYYELNVENAAKAYVRAICAEKLPQVIEGREKMLLDRTKTLAFAIKQGRVQTPGKDSLSLVLWAAIEFTAATVHGARAQAFDRLADAIERIDYETERTMRRRRRA